MRVRFTGTPDFWLAFLGAPFAGAVATTLAALLVFASSGSDGVAPEEAIVGSLQAGLFGLAICAAFTLVVGGCVVVYVRWSRRVPSLQVALVAGLALAAGGVLLLNEGAETMKIPALFGGASSLATAWAFWRLGLRGRTIAP